MAAFEKAYKDLDQQGIRTRAVVSQLSHSESEYLEELTG